MRDFVLVFVSALIASILTYAIADRAASAQAHSAAVVTDEESGMVRITIDGQDVVRIDSAGLHVAGDITYTGIQADIGSNETEAEHAP